LESNDKPQKKDCGHNLSLQIPGHGREARELTNSVNGGREMGHRRGVGEGAHKMEESIGGVPLQLSLPMKQEAKGK